MIGCMSERAQLTIQDNPEQSRYEALDESGAVAGFAEYKRRNGVVVFLHTEVDDAMEGMGVGSALVRGALDDVRGSGLRVRPLCPFFKSYIEKHAEYQDLVNGG
jgi:predicted GNAT family acetyltransferase